MPLVAVAPILLTGFGKWIEGKETPFKAALESLDGGELNITRRLDFPTGDTLTNMRKGILAKTIVRYIITYNKDDPNHERWTKGTGNRLLMKFSRSPVDDDIDDNDDYVV